MASPTSASSWRINFPLVILVLYIFFFSLSALTTPSSPHTENSLFGKLAHFLHAQDEKGRNNERWSRREMRGVGSSPPRCTSKCGRCRPCKPVHVPVPPGTPVTTEYYPEAWRCKCGNRLFMP